MTSGLSKASKADKMAIASLPGEGVESWPEFRQRLANNRDRLRALQLIAAAIDYEPLPHQMRSHFSGSRFKLICGGVGSGKTLWSCVETVLLSILNPGCSGAMVSPTYDAVQHVLLPEFMRIADALASMGTPILRRYHKSMARADLIGGGSIYFRSFSRVDSIRGWNLAFAAIDETEQSVGNSPTYIFEVIAGRLRDPKAKVYQLHCTTTPKGARGVPLLFHQRRQTDARKDWYTVRASSMSNTHLDPTFVESLKQGYSKRAFRQEILAEVLKPSNVCFPEFDRSRHCIPYAYDRTREYYISCDWGYNSPAVVWVQETPYGYVVFDEFVEDEVPEGKLKQVIEDRCKKLGRPPSRCVGDRADKYMMRFLIEAFPRAYVQRMTSKDEQSVKAGLEVLRSFLDPVYQDEPVLFVSQALAQDPPRRGIVRSMENYRWKQNAEGLPLDGIPFKDQVTDHIMDAVRMLCRVLDKDKSGSLVVGNKHGQSFSRKSSSLLRSR